MSNFRNKPNMKSLLELGKGNFRQMNKKAENAVLVSGLKFQNQALVPRCLEYQSTKLP